MPLGVAISSVMGKVRFEEAVMPFYKSTLTG